MRLRDVVLKSSLGRSRLYHLTSPSTIEVNAAAMRAIEQVLEGQPEAPSEGARLVDRLRELGMVEDACFESVPRSDHSDLVSIEVEATNRCNLQCHHCFVETGSRRLAEGNFEAALAGAIELGAVEWTFNGGEPLVHTRCLDWVEAVRSAGLRCVLFTNGTLVDADKAERLAAARVALVRVSLDGMVTEHDALRGSGAFAGAVAGIRHLVSAGVVVDATMVVHPGNVSSVEKVRRFCGEELGVRRVRLSAIAPMGRAAAAVDLELSDADFAALYANTPLRRARSPRPGLLPCGAGVDKLFVASDGRVFPCHLFEHPAAALGALDERSLPAIYNDTSAVAGLATSPRDAVDHFAPARLGECQACPELAVCLGGCRGRAWRVRGHAWAADPVTCRRRGVRSD